MAKEATIRNAKQTAALTDYLLRFSIGLAALLRLLCAAGVHFFLAFFLYRLVGGSVKLNSCKLNDGNRLEQWRALKCRTAEKKVNAYGEWSDTTPILSLMNAISWAIVHRVNTPTPHSLCVCVPFCDCLALALIMQCCGFSFISI